jgi:hypothetical protein
MPAQTMSHPSAPAVRVPISLAKICSVVLVFVAMLAAACVPMQVSWLWLLLPLVFLIYLDASSSGAFLVSALMSHALWVFYGGLLAVAVTFEFGGLHRHESGSANVAASGSGCGCGAGKAPVANGAAPTPMVNPPARTMPVSAVQRPNASMRPVSPGAAQARSTAAAMPLRKAAPLAPGANGTAATPAPTNPARAVPAPVPSPTSNVARPAGPATAQPPRVESGNGTQPSTALPAVPPPALPPAAPSAPATNPK